MSICKNNLQNLKHGVQKFNKLLDYFNKNNEDKYGHGFNHKSFNLESRFKLSSHP